jgi:hypothetical protein
MRKYKNDASCINNKRGMARRAKRHSAHQERQFLKKCDKEWAEQIKPLLEKIRESEIITAEDLNKKIG